MLTPGLRFLYKASVFKESCCYAGSEDQHIKAVQGSVFSASIFCGDTCVSGARVFSSCQNPFYLPLPHEVLAARMPSYSLLCARCLPSYGLYFVMSVSANQPFGTYTVLLSGVCGAVGALFAASCCLGAVSTCFGAVSGGFVGETVGESMRST
jgi:hypothetical protein